MPEIDKESEKILQKKVQNEVDDAIKELRKENITAFLLRISMMTTHVDNHIVKNCTFTEDLNTKINCIKKANNIRVKSLNKLGEMLVEKCGGKMIYLKEE